MQRSSLWFLLSAGALVVALAALLGPRTAPAAAGSLVAQIGPASMPGGFTYQGTLARGGRPVDGAGACDLRFSLWDAASAGAQLGAAQTLTGVDFARGLFTVTLNDSGQFGDAAFTGDTRWLAVEAACPGGGAFTSLGRQAITGVPYAAVSGSTRALQGRPVSTAAPSAGQVLRWDGSAWAPGATHTRTILVSPADSPATSGARLLAAVAAASDSSAEKPYLIKIEPGIYDLGFSTLQMRSYVDIEGSGQGVTIIRGERQTDDVTGLVNAASNTELRQLSIEVTEGSGAFAVGISNNNASPRITDVTIRTDGATSYGIVSRSGAGPRIERVTISATGATVFAAGLAHFDGGTLTLVDSALQAQAAGDGKSAGLYIDKRGGDTPTATVVGGSIEGGGASTNERNGIHILGGVTVRFSNVRIKAAYVPFRFTNGGTVLVIGSEIDTASGIYGFGQGLPWYVLKCIGSYEPDLTPLGAGCVP